MRAVLFDVRRKEVAQVDGVVGGEGDAVELIAEDALVGYDGLDSVVHWFDVIGLLDVLDVQALKFGCGLVDGDLELHQVGAGERDGLVGRGAEGGDFAG